LLKDAKAEGEEAPWVDAQRGKEDARKAKKEQAVTEIMDAIGACGGPGKATITAVSDVVGCAEKTVRRRVAALKSYRVDEGVVHAK
jgi:hypothetical protein